MGDAAVAAMQRALSQSVGAQLADVCAETHVRHGGAAGGNGGASHDGGGNGGATAHAASGGAAGGGGGLRARSHSAVASLGGGGGSLSDWLAAESDPPIGDACCGALSHVYAAQPFREWWSEGEAGRTRHRSVRKRFALTAPPTTRARSLART